MAKMGRPTDYRPEYCEMLENHMKSGGSFRSFGALVHTTEKTLHTWLDAQPDFLQSKRRGELYSAKFYEDMGKMMAAGQMKRIVRETPILGADGKVQYDNQGNVIYEREYAPASTNATVWIFMMKNMHKWRDNVNLAVSGDGEGGSIKIDHRAESFEEKIKRLEEANKVLKELEDGVIDITGIQRKLDGSSGLEAPRDSGEDQDQS